MTSIPSHELFITTEQLDEKTVRVHVTGEIDLATAPHLRAALLAVAETATPSTEIAVDLAGVRFIDAGGVGVLIRARSAARLAGAGFSVHNPQRIAARIIDILGLTEALRVTHPGRSRAQPLAEKPGATS